MERGGPGGICSVSGTLIKLLLEKVLKHLFRCESAIECLM